MQIGLKNYLFCHTSAVAIGRVKKYFLDLKLSNIIHLMLKKLRKTPSTTMV